MPSQSLVRSATLADIPYLPAIEKSAGALFRTVPAIAYFADHDSTQTPEELAKYCAAGTLWVAESVEDDEVINQGTLCGFLASQRVDDSFYISELSVHSDFQRRGFGGLLLRAVSEHATSLGLTKVSLITEREVAWNGPMYRRKGFHEVEHSALGPEHLKIIEDEAESGMDTSRRALMVLDITK